MEQMRNRIEDSPLPVGIKMRIWLSGWTGKDRTSKRIFSLGEQDRRNQHKGLIHHKSSMDLPFWYQKEPIIK